MFSLLNLVTFKIASKIWTGTWTDSCILTYLRVYMNNIDNVKIRLCDLPLTSAKGKWRKILRHDCRFLSWFRCT